LNGVAQGFVTDRVADLLLAAGFGDVLIDLGEGRALGHGPDGRTWRAAVADPAAPERMLFELPLGGARGARQALATSGGYGTRFGPDPRVHHLLDPATGRSANYHASVSVAAPRATLADGLSTTLSILPPEGGAKLLAAYPSARAWFVDAAGRVSGPEGAPGGVPV
jgi:thiamine biosynthesis lipoprotein